MVTDPAFEPAPIETRLRVATWNLWWRFGPWQERLPRIVAELGRVDADVVCLQEVWGADDTTAAREIARELGLHAAEASDLEMEPGVTFGNAVLSRWPIADSEHRALPAGDAPHEQRLVLRAGIDGVRGPFQVFTTHLNWRFDHGHIRQDQVETIARFVQDSRPRTYPPILCGDFNAVPTSDEIRTLTGERAVVAGLVMIDAWAAARPDDVGYTWDDTNPFVASQLEQNRRIDYVFTGWHKQRGAGQPVAAELIGAVPIDGMYPSDHFGVVAELRY